MNISPSITINSIITKFFSSDKQQLLKSCSNLNTDDIVLYLCLRYFFLKLL